MTKCCGTTTELFLIQPRLLFSAASPFSPIFSSGSRLAGDLFRYLPAGQSFGSEQTILTNFVWEDVNGLGVARIYWDDSKAKGPIRVQFTWLSPGLTYYQEKTSDNNPVVLDQIRRVNNNDPLFALATSANKSPLAITYCPAVALCPPLPSSVITCDTQLFVLPAEFLGISGGMGQGEFPAIQLLGADCPIVSSFSWTVVDGLVTLTISLNKAQRVAVQLDFIARLGIFLPEELHSAFNQYLEAEGTSIVLNDIRNVITGALYAQPGVANPIAVANLSIRPLTDCCCKTDTEVWEIPSAAFVNLPPEGGSIVADIPLMTKLIPTGRTGLLSRLELVRTTIVTEPTARLELFHFVLVWPKELLCCLQPVSISIAFSLAGRFNPDIWQELDFHTVGVPLASGDELRGVTQPLSGFVRLVTPDPPYAIDYTKIAIRYSCCRAPEPGCKPAPIVELVA